MKSAVHADSGTVRQGFSRACLGLLGLFGWRTSLTWPPEPRGLIMVYPHTSNWDFPIGLATMLALGLRITWLGKHQIFRGPLRWLWRAFGGVPVDRSHPDGVVEQAAAVLAPSRSTFLAIAPEGTRRKVERWKSGFWRIARASGAPIFPVAFDYRRRTVVLGELFFPTADYETDLAALQSRFCAEMARNPANY